MRCIARAYGDEPLEREVVGEGEHVIYVVNPSRLESGGTPGAGGVGFPRDSVFAYDSVLLHDLRAAYESEDKERLLALWDHAKPLSGAKV